MRLPARTAVRTTAASTLLATFLLASPAQAAALVCGGSPAPNFGNAALNTTLNTKFSTYGNSNTLLDDWTGADSTYSVKLPDGRTVFGFSDTFLGQINGTSRPPTPVDGGTTPFLNNTFVVQAANGTMSTVHGGTVANPTAPMPPRDNDHVYWAGDLTTHGSEVQQPYREYEKTDDGSAIPARFHRNVLARFSPGNLAQPLEVRALPSSRKIMWGSALLKDGGYTYIYGTEDLGVDGKHLYIARVSGTDLRGTWWYRTSTAGTWSTSEASAHRMLSGVSNEFSVTKRGNFSILVTQDTKEAFSAQIDSYLSCSPDGPFTDEREIYRTTEGGWGSLIYTYNAHAHNSMNTTNNLVVSYNVNSLDTTPGPDKDVYRDVSIYRPRFVNVPVSG